MKLGKEWDKRITIWLEELQKDFFFPLGAVPCSGFTTLDMLTPEEALAHEFVSMPVGTPWGRKWEYGWFRTEIILPAAAQGQRIIFSPDVGGEMLIWVNGRVAGSKDLEHAYITLTRSAQAGEHFDILIESYAGHGPRLENGGPYPPGRVPVPEPPEFQVKVGPAVYAIWNEAAYQLGLDVYTLTKLLSMLDDKSLRAQRVADGLKQFTYLVDFEQPPEKRIEGYIAAREALAPLMQCVNGSTAPEFTIFGQSHLDLAWKWPFEETKRKCARTLSSQLALMDEYPEYRFMLCEPPILEVVQTYYPELYSRVQAKISNGQMIPEGAFYVECDTNIPNGESLIRQFTLGAKWFREEAGCTAKMAWLPDSFGFSAALPQIMAGCGVRYFATQKLLRSHPETDPFPYNIFMWEGLDGTRILSHMLMKNNSGIDPQLLVQRWTQDRNQQEDIDTFMFPFGYGDGGGGPTRDIYELARRVSDLEGAPRTRLDSPIAFFEAIERKGEPKNRYVGELYLQWHRGAYTSLAKLKKGNRRAETALHEAEFWSTLAPMVYPAEELTVLWKKVLFNQFHDVLAGTSITRVNEEAARDFEEVIADASSLTDAALGMFTIQAPSEGKALTLFNSLSWERQVLVRLPQGMNGARDMQGNLLPAQTTDEGTLVRATVPACGYTTISLVDSLEVAPGAGYGSRAYRLGEQYVLENDSLRLQVDASGQLVEILDKETGLQYAEGPCNAFKMYKDVNIEYDAWEIGSMYEALPVALAQEAEIDIVLGEAAPPASEGFLKAGIRVRRRLHDSPMVQTITLEQDSRRVDFETEIDWQEQHKLLKVAFPVRVHADEALHEIQFGYIRRPTHKSRRYDADRYEVSQHRYTALAEAGHGFAVLNDCKYGVSVDGGCINLTLLKAPVIPDMYADKGRQAFTYSCYAYNGSFADSGVVQNGYELNTPILVREGDSGTASLFTVEMSETLANKNPWNFAYANVILETVKRADDGSGDLIVRLYESQNTAAKCVLHTPLAVQQANQTNMLEEAEAFLPTDGHSVALTFRPFEVKTVRLSLGD